MKIKVTKIAFYFILFAMVMWGAGLLSVRIVNVVNAIVENPELVDGNPSCQDLGYQYEYKVDPPNDGTYEVTDVGFVTLTNTDVGQFDWSSTFGIDAVIAKGGPNANIYRYSPSETSDYGLSTPIDPDNQTPYGLSHVSFCYDELPDTGECQLEVTKSTEDDSVEPGDNIVYQLTLENIGDGDCTGGGVLLRDVFDINTSYVSADPTPATTTSEYIEWNFDVMEPGDYEEVELTMLVSVQASCDSTLTNTAKFWSTETGWSESEEEAVEYTDVFCEEVDQCTPESDDYEAELDKADIGDTASESYHTIDGWSAANIPGGYGGCQNGAVCDYRQVIEDPCTEEERAASVILHAGDNIVDSLTVRHLDGVSLMDSFEVYINSQKVGQWDDITQISTEEWRETSFDISSYEFTGDLTVELVAFDDIWGSCGTYGQVAIDWITIQGCGTPWSPPFCGNEIVEEGEDCDAGPNGSDSCTSECTLIEQEPFCGNEVVEEGEQCDWDEPQACTTEDGYAGLETCNMPPIEITMTLIDPPNGLYCTWNTCETTEYCGDEITNGNEDCDAGPNGSDSCTSECTSIEIPPEGPYCGDGEVNQEWEQCDGEGSYICETEDGYIGTQSCDLDYCTWNDDCTSEEYCGDEIVNGNEQCDAGEGGSDSCTSECTVIETPPPVCVSNCGGGGGGGGNPTNGPSNINLTAQCTDADLTWLTSKSSVSWVVYGTEPGNYTEEYKGIAEKVGHSVNLPGLTENTTYYYVIKMQDGVSVVSSPEYSFTTDDDCGQVLGVQIDECTWDWRVSGSDGVDADIVGQTEFADGSLLRACATPDIYRLENQKGRYIKSLAELAQYIGQRIFNVSDAVLALFL